MTPTHGPARGLVWLLRILFWPSRRLKARRFSQSWKLQTSSGLRARDGGEPEIAERHFRAALAALQQFEPLDPRLGFDPRLADSFRHLAALHGDCGAFALMAAAIEETRAVASAHGSNAPEAMEWLTRLADLYLGIGGKIWGTAGGYWYGIGAKLHERVRDIREELLGPDHPLLAQSLETVAGLYHNDHGDDSGPIYRRALEIKERALGPDHPDLARTLENCAGANDDDYYGGSVDADTLLRRALAIRERAFGPRHPEVARSKERLARLCARSGRGPEAETLASEALGIREEIQGQHHPDVALTLGLLAGFSHAKARHNDAERLFSHKEIRL